MRRVAFVVPPGSTWPLPLYELALMLAERAYEMCAERRAPLRHAGGRAAASCSAPRPRARSPALLAEAGIVLHTARDAEVVAPGRLHRARRATLEVDRIVTAAAPRGPERSPGCPPTPAGFLVTDVHARVQRRRRTSTPPAT